MEQTRKRPAKRAFDLRAWRKHGLIAGSAALLFLLSLLILRLSAGAGQDCLIALAAGLGNGIRRITNLFPFSLMEVFLAALAAGVVLSLFFFFRRIFLGRFSAAWLIACKLLLAASLLFFAFTVLMGVCYNGPSVQEQMGLSAKTYTTSQLEALTVLLAQRCNETAASLAPSDYERSFESYSLAVSRGYDVLQEELPFLEGVSARPKPVFGSVVLCYLGIDGICFPFTAEANVNRLLPSFAQPNVMAHEIAHSRRVAREDEASFVGMLANFAGGDAFAAYSSYQSALIYAYNALYSDDPARAAQIYQTLSPAVLADMKALGAFYRRFESPVQDVSSAVNDGYLKAQGQTEGTRSYGRVVDLLIAWQLAGNFS